jgi:glutamyl-tRNA synthetase/glutamyl-Q tRNA(Asp) synthetase
VWGIARACGARVFLRIEDHDRGRSRPEHVAAIVRDLAWLGFAWENDLDRERDAELEELLSSDGPFTQSRRGALYERIAADLAARGLVYGCTCSRREIEAAGDAEAAELVYPGTCRDRGIPPGPGVTWRVRLPPGSVTFRDLVVGECTQEPALQCGDLSIRDRNGYWTYQLAVVVDDLYQDMDLVVRGQDLLESTGRQILLRRMLSPAPPPAFAHHALVVDSTGRKLSKRTFAEAIAARREAGVPPEAVLGEVARALGWQDADRTAALDECLDRVASALA